MPVLVLVLGAILSAALLAYRYAIAGSSRNEAQLTITQRLQARAVGTGVVFLGAAVINSVILLAIFAR